MTEGEDLQEDVMFPTLANAADACLADHACASVVYHVAQSYERSDGAQHVYTLHRAGGTFSTMGTMVYQREASCTPPAPPPAPPGAPPPLFDCDDREGRSNARLLATPKWCYQLRKAQFNCSEFYATGLQMVTNFCYDAGGSSAFCETALAINCVSPPPPNPRAPPPDPRPPPNSPPPSPPDCEGGRRWRTGMPPIEATCSDPSPVQAQQNGQNGSNGQVVVARCACPGDQLFDAHESGRCVVASACPAAAPSPPPPPFPPPPSPLPPLFPRSTGDAYAALQPCTSLQEAQNNIYCYDPRFATQICDFDGGVHCPERCGLCRRQFADPSSSFSMRLVFVVDIAIEAFDVDAFSQKLADALAISAHQIATRLSTGSVVVETTIATVSGTEEDAVSLAATATQTFPSASAATATLGVPVSSAPVASSVAANPSPPPSPPAPPAPPPPSPTPTPPPPTPSPDDAGSEDGEDGGVPMVATVVGVAVAGLVLVVVFFACTNRPNDDNRLPPYGFPPGSYAPVVVYASSAVGFVGRTGGGVVSDEEGEKKRTA